MLAQHRSLSELNNTAIKHTSIILNENNSMASSKGNTHAGMPKMFLKMLKIDLLQMNAMCICMANIS